MNEKPKWKREKKRWELWQGDCLLAICEPAQTRGHWWWSLWAPSGCPAGYEFSLDEAKKYARSAAAR